MPMLLPEPETIERVFIELGIETDPEICLRISEQTVRSCHCTHHVSRCEQCQRAKNLENELLEKLALRCFPIVAGLLDRLAKRIEELGGRVRDDDVLQVARIIAFRLFFGTCDCFENGDDKRMHRAISCGDEHKLRGWRGPECLRVFLKNALINEKEKPGKFDEADPKKIRTDCFNLLKNRNAKDFARGMALRMVDLDIRGRSVRFGVFQIPQCERCGNNVSIRNECGCEKSVDRFPLVSSLIYIVDDVSVRKDLNANSPVRTPMYRSRKLDNGTCIHGGDKKGGGTLLFPLWNGEIPECPQCGLQASGKTSNPEMEIRQIPVQYFKPTLPPKSKSMEVEAVDQDQACRGIIDRLLNGLLCPSEEATKAELAELYNWVGNQFSSKSMVCPELLATKIASLTPEAQDYIRRLF
jgi:hypothetical protein